MGVSKTRPMSLAMYRGSRQECDKVMTIIKALMEELTRMGYEHNLLEDLFKALGAWVAGDGLVYFTMNPLTLDAHAALMKFTTEDEWIVYDVKDNDVIDDFGNGEVWDSPYKVVSYRI